ncbi:MAG: CHAT domain-containing protein [Cyanobacteria bacterium J007]|nr:MAG: CHAT domain-containing protein [Cyanobacteria bacterium J007]
MKKIVTFKFSHGNFQEGFPVILTMGEEGKSTHVEIGGYLPGMSEVLDALHNWQKDFCNCLKNAGNTSQDTYRIKNVTSGERASSHSAKKLKETIDEWLNTQDRSWCKIRDRLQQYLECEDEIRAIVQTEYKPLRELPWQVWNVFSDYYPRCEIAVGAIEYTVPTSQSLQYQKVRILAVLGRSDNINIQFDRQLLDCLPKTEVEIVFLEQPTKRELLEQLGDPRGWHIFFFAGHSSTREDGIGEFDLNSQETLSIETFKNTFRGAISKGLQIAIFNSCDGLGLANQLAELNLPQSIVMRQSIPDRLAQEFLEYFLSTFSSNESFYMSVLSARKKLADLHDSTYPGSSWLPVICQNPLVHPPSWQDFLPDPSWKHQLTLIEHSQPVITVAMSPDGKMVASGGQDNTIMLWDLATGQLLRRLTGHGSPILSLAFSPDGKTLASSSNHEFNDGTIALWDVETGQLKQSLGRSLVALRVGSLAFSPDGQYLASGHIGFTLLDTAIRIWQLDTGKNVYDLKGHGWEVTSVAFSKDGKLVVSGGADGAIMLWNWRAERRLRTLNRPDDFFGSLSSWFDRSIGIIWAIALSPNGQMIASGGSQQPIQLWDVQSGKLLRSLTEHEDSVLTVAFSPDGKTLASGGSDCTIRLWKIDTGETIAQFKHLGSVKSLAFSPDGRTLVSGSWDRTVKVWSFSI